ncbi:hypothetical protein V0288_02130 [Pannus brasiliensis CCIBt3594]|uniref:Uncharacterized protein n=1 Tax=Pannus brasiliensis CCIBt3594 TaxID=1427578 RepID=A0AAW9QL82_9CHRO
MLFRPRKVNFTIVQATGTIDTAGEGEGRESGKISRSIARLILTRSIEPRVY